MWQSLGCAAASCAILWPLEKAKFGSLIVWSPKHCVKTGDLRLATVIDETQWQVLDCVTVSPAHLVALSKGHGPRDWPADCILQNSDNSTPLLEYAAEAGFFGIRRGFLERLLKAGK